MTPTVLHLFAGIGGCTRGMQIAGFKSLGSIDVDGAGAYGVQDPGEAAGSVLEVAGGDHRVDRQHDPGAHRDGDRPRGEGVPAVEAVGRVPARAGRVGAARGGGDSMSDLSVVPCTISAARVFVGRHHRHHRAPVGALFALAVARNGTVVGVGSWSRPSRPRTDQHPTQTKLRWVVGETCPKEKTA